MRLRNRVVGVGETFHPFKRLPTELRQIIWRLTLEPRIVEVGWKTSVGEKDDIPSFSDEADIEDEYDILSISSTEPEIDDEDDSSPKSSSEPELPDIEFFSYVPLPSALLVSRDSRDAVLRLYPLCFASSTSGPQVRFNFALDTLYLDDEPYEEHHTERCIFELLRGLSPVEHSKLEKLALSRYIGFDNDESTWDDDRDRILQFIGKFTALTNVLIVTNILVELPYSADLTKVEGQVHQEYDSDQRERGMEFFPEYPEELAQRFKGSDYEVPGDPLMEHSDSQKWVEKGARPVWGWRHIKYNRPAAS
ncbi:uncharacterized protein PAC_12615 [Phialocephala subalpina]|uniref:2EXR domain-containing protein n=1 Tax=Phialocephala subalpina TaxID=576137 RepID=A0A1L7XCH7_9HELO|nr:uncharacterized protein PAC_12615 [Phialocephala subalpina]